MTIIHKADKRKGAAPARAAAPEMDRTAANCLCCGKVYDCRESSSNDVRMFVGEQHLKPLNRVTMHSHNICKICEARKWLYSMHEQQRLR